MLKHSQQRPATNFEKLEWRLASWLVEGLELYEDQAGYSDPAIEVSLLDSHGSLQIINRLGERSTTDVRVSMGDEGKPDTIQTVVIKNPHNLNETTADVASTFQQLSSGLWVRNPLGTAPMFSALLSATMRDVTPEQWTQSQQSIPPMV